jgi:hypothetical protein
MDKLQIWDRYINTTCRNLHILFRTDEFAQVPEYSLPLIRRMAAVSLYDLTSHPSTSIPSCDAKHATHV